MRKEALPTTADTVDPHVHPNRRWRYFNDMQTLYIMSGIDNAPRIARLRDRFSKLGVTLTYDWTKHGKILDTTVLPLVAAAEVAGVIAAKCVLLVTPGFCGTHFEAGLAYGKGIPIVLLAESVPDGNPVSFHYLPGIKRCETEDQAVALVMATLNGP